MSAIVIRGECFEDQSPPNMAYVVGSTGSPLTQAGVSTITYTVTERDSGKIILASTSLTVANIIFDTLQMPAIWTVDDTGYNFRHDAPATTLPQSGRWYRFEYKLTLAAGGVAWVIFEIYCKPLHTS